MKKIIAAIFLGGLFFSLNSPAADLKESKFTQVVNDVQVITSDKAIKSAAVNGLFDMPDVLRTGAASRAELVADDRTITRVGANTIFSFDQANRTIDLQQGSLLFHSDKGKGGGTIRTGAATASVLGTTLIVVTTPSGGFKVLLLEGHGEVHFSNGKKQHLDAGQMTFVLPGGLPGPVFYFLLSDQVAHSLLVQGFSQPLSSLPLINNVIGTQNKLILSGKAVDTGLLVAGEPNPANPSTVPVVYVLNSPSVSAPPSPGSTGPSGPSLSGAQLALTQDFGINSSTLNPNNVFIQRPGFDVNDPSTFLSVAVGNPFYGFPGNNLTITTPTIDLTPYANQVSLNYPYFDLVAMNNINIQNSLTFTGLLPADQLFLSAGNHLTIASGSAVEADVADFELGSYAAMTLDNVSVLNNSGNVAVYSHSDVTLKNGATVGTGATGTINISSASGSVTINNNATLAAFNVNVSAGGDITLDNANFAGGGTPAVGAPVGNQVNLTAGDTATMGSVTASPIPLDMSSFMAINVQAPTIVIVDTEFGNLEIVNLHPATPVANFMAAPTSYVIPREANFYGDSIGGTPLSSTSQITFSASPGSTPGVHIY